MRVLQLSLVGKWFKSGIWNDQNTALGIAVKILFASSFGKKIGTKSPLERPKIIFCFSDFLIYRLSNSTILTFLFHEVLAEYSHSTQRI